MRSPVDLRKFEESFERRYFRGISPSSTAREHVKGSTRPPAALVGPSVPSVATLAKQHADPGGRDAIAIAQARAISWFRPPMPCPRTVTVVSPAARTHAGALMGLPVRPISRAIAAKNLAISLASPS